MKKFSAKEIIKPTVSLFLTAAVVTLLLAVTNSVTAPKIEELQIKTVNETKSKVLPGADSFSDELTVSYNGTEYSYYEGYKNSQTAGYIFTTVSKGYGGDITVMVGVDASGSVEGIDFITISETAGLGMKADTDDFKSRYKGKSGVINVVKNSPGENDIQALTGATITSNAVTQAVNTALELYGEVSR